MYIAAEGATFSLLQQEFPDLQFLLLAGYRVKYSRKKYFLPLAILIQVPKIIFTISREHQWLKKTIKKYKIDIVISDNRFGLYNKKARCIYITHQLLIRTGNLITEKIAQTIHYRFIKKYDQCWVPDFEKDGLAGELSHPALLPGNIKYIGMLSRFELPANTQRKYDLLISISGPEPQRKIFEEKILRDLGSFSGTALFIRGMPESSELVHVSNPGIGIKNHLTARELNAAILQSDIVISRCGYTTVMDLVKLKKKAILVPTPGQTEQEYLAKYLMDKKIFYTVDQKYFSLRESLEQAAEFPFAMPAYDMEDYKKTIAELVRYA